MPWKTDFFLKRMHSLKKPWGLTCTNFTAVLYEYTVKIALLRQGQNVTFEVKTAVRFRLPSSGT